jgi:hypothetical protein
MIATDTLSIEAIADRLRAGILVPYLGPEMSELAAGAVPTTYAELAEWFSKKVALPKRARGNAWSSAQFIESKKFRATVDKLMAEAFASPVPPSPLHRLFARLDLPLIVDTWYDGAMRTALAGQESWGEIQAIARAQPGEARWYRAYDAAGAPVSLDAVEGWRTLLYKPHGGAAPAGNFLITDSDYVEVLTEIDIQTPIPDAVQQRRTGRGILFLGCRFDDQMLRTYARQIMKRSGGPHFAIVDRALLTQNELKMFEEQEIQVLDMSLPAFAEALLAVC